MSLLVDLSSSSLDPGYADAAARRAAGAAAGGGGDAATSGRRRGPGLVVGVLTATLLIVIAAVQAHVRAPDAARTRADLVASVGRQTRAIGDLSRQVTQLRAAVARLRDASLAGSTSGAALSAQIGRQELASGALPVNGPGLRVTLNDAPSSDTARNRVLDRDLQAVVNALWAAGAEAVAINGQRLSAQSAIRQAGDAILVDFQPLRPPYVVQAIGDPVGMETTFAQSAAAARMRSYVQLYGLRFAYARASSLDVPAGVEEQLHDARPVHEPSSDRPTPNEKGSG